MKQITLLFLCGLMLAITTCAEPPATEVQEPAFDAAVVKMQIEQNNALFSDALAAGDAAALAALYTPNAVLLPPDAVTVTGKAAIEEFWTAVIASGAKGVRLTTLQLDGADDIAYEIGSALLTVQPEGQDPMEVPGKYIVVWKKGEDGTWRLHADIWNTDAP